ncbi:MAG: hypothetical protein SFX73_18920 [Kofleriaceae bacterium]|nr:hypothetical protein [Kofleriaceae bacterium]
MRAALVALVLASACYAAAKKDHLFRRAALDFNCSSKLLTYTELETRKMLVEGCGQRGTYVEACDGDRYASGTTCTWKLEGALESLGPQRVDGPPGSVL